MVTPISERVLPPCHPIRLLYPPCALTNPYPNYRLRLVLAVWRRSTSMPGVQRGRSVPQGDSVFLSHFFHSLEVSYVYSFCSTSHARRPAPNQSWVGAQGEKLGRAACALGVYSRGTAGGHRHHRCLDRAVVASRPGGT